MHVLFFWPCLIFIFLFVYILLCTGFTSSVDTIFTLFRKVSTIASDGVTVANLTMAFPLAPPLIAPYLPTPLDCLYFCYKPFPLHIYSPTYMPLGFPLCLFLCMNLHCYLLIHFCLCLHLRLGVFPCLRLQQKICLRICLPLHMCLGLCICLRLRLRISLHLYIFLRLYICLRLLLRIHLCIRLCLCLRLKILLYIQYTSYSFNNIFFWFVRTYGIHYYLISFFVHETIIVSIMCILL